MSDYNFFLAIAKNHQASEAEREEAFRVLADIGDQSILSELKALYEQKENVTANFKAALLSAIGSLTIRLDKEERASGKDKH